MKAMIVCMFIVVIVGLYLIIEIMKDIRQTIQDISERIGVSIGKIEKNINDICNELYDSRERNTERN